MQTDQIQKDIDSILNSRKYKGLHIPRETLEDLFVSNTQKAKNQKELVKLVRRKLHNVIAPYLGDPDYARSRLALEAAFSDADNDKKIKSTCLEILTHHASTHERIPHLEEFYASIFKITGTPKVILDLACGLNPLSFRWMNLPDDVKYRAYDLHLPRICLINRYFELEGIPTLAEHRDILVDPPDIQADLGFFFKEAHRFEQRQHGCNRTFWLALNVKHLIVTLPATSLDGRRSLIERHHRLVENAINDLNWNMVDLTIGEEIIFIITK